MLDRLIGANLATLRYCAASLAALGVDLALFVAGLDLGLSAAISATTGYVAGFALHWLLSIYCEAPAETARQHQAAFAGSALLGLGVTVTVIGWAMRIGADPATAKLAAAAAAFNATFLFRRRTLPREQAR